ncbi:MAG TPA: hypothetical protein VHA82_04015 [Ramlibacter sp.]|nr:hypothetical protein [Ramlibacter sp.]
MNDNILGGSGGDTLVGLDGDDTLTGGTGNDGLVGGAGNDVASFSGPKSDYYIEWTGNSEWLVIDSVPGRDGTDQAVDVERLRFADGEVERSAYTGPAIFGTTANDTLVGTDLSEGFDGGAGADHIAAGAGGDFVMGNFGDDFIDGGAGSDWLDGVVGNDTLIGGPGDDFLDPGIGTDSLVGGEGIDIAVLWDLHGATVDLQAGSMQSGESSAVLASIEGVLGTSSPDTISGNAEANLLVGDFGADTLSGGAGNDTLEGEGDSDSLIGGDGTDVARWSEPRSQFAIWPAAGGYVVSQMGSSYFGADTLTGIERLEFQHQVIAIDLDGNAGETARILGAALGAGSVHDTSLVGIGLHLLDSGWTASQLADAVARLVSADTSDDAFVSQLYTNVVHAAPSQATVQAITELLSSGAFDRGSLLLMAAHTPVNEESIDLAHLVGTGLPYIAYG